MKRILVWFRRDIRTEDNTALIEAVTSGAEIFPCFVLDTEIFKDLPKNDPRLYFQAEALCQLDDALRRAGGKLILLKGDPVRVIPESAKSLKADAVFVNESVSRYGKKRDDAVLSRLQDAGISFFAFDDTLLVPIKQIPARKVYSAFYRLWEREVKPVPRGFPAKQARFGMAKGTKLACTVQLPETKLLLDPWKGFDFTDVLDSRNLDDYENKRNFPACEGTSRISPFLRFGVVSVRQVFRHFREKYPEQIQLQKELAWREFWFHIAHSFPDSLDREFLEKRRGIPWNDDHKALEAWKAGMTGYPIVDAGMRQLCQEGWMHNRARMITASFLTKDLLIDWRKGEQYFADLLLDHEEAVNIGNWQWSASVGADPKPLRIFNPTLQSQKYDSDADYIKKYLPELRKFDPAKIHEPLKHDLGYAKPIVDHKAAAMRTKQAYLDRSG